MMAKNPKSVLNWSVYNWSILNVYMEKQSIAIVKHTLLPFANYFMIEDFCKYNYIGNEFQCNLIV